MSRVNHVCWSPSVRGLLTSCLRCFDGKSSYNCFYSSNVTQRTVSLSLSHDWRSILISIGFSSALISSFLCLGLIEDLLLGFGKHFVMIWYQCLRWWISLCFMLIFSWGNSRRRLPWAWSNWKKYFYRSISAFFNYLIWFFYKFINNWI